MEYGVVKIPRELVDAVEDIIKRYPELGYSTNAELIKEAVRIHLKEIRKSGQKK